ncbi:MAG: hypothetical protein IJA32_01030 [Lachnospiraceae bacterium]|nr:hypothetical protein [Lachnospiraceae bacterium]
MKFRAEVEMISITEYDKQLHEQTLREDGFEDGREIGREEGREQGELKNLSKQVQKKLKKEKTYEVIAEELETDLAVVEEIGEVIKNASSDSMQEELVKILMEKDLKLDDSWF